jgi:hypothetical protein
LGEATKPGEQLCCAAPTGGGRYCPPHRALMIQGGRALTERDIEVIVAIARKAA